MDRNMNSFLKENFALIIAIALPLVFALFFMATKQIGNVNVEPPQHDFILKKSQYNNVLNIKIIDGRIRADFTYPVLHNNTPVTLDPFSLYLVDAQTLIAEPLYLDLPDDAQNPAQVKQGTTIEIPLGSLSERRYSGAGISPDGFELDSTYHHDGNLMTEIFSAGRNYDYNLALHKDGARFDIKGLNDHYGYEIAAWIIESEE